MPEFQLQAAPPRFLGRLGGAARERVRWHPGVLRGRWLCNRLNTPLTRHRYAMRTGFTMMVLPDTTVAFDATSELPLSFSRQVRSKPARIES